MRVSARTRVGVESARIGRGALAVLALAAACGQEPVVSKGFAGATIGFVFVGARDDLGYNQAAWEGSEAVARAFPDHRVLRVENVPETEAASKAMEDLIRKGARILFATSYGHLPFAAEVARRHPSIIVLHQGGIEPAPRLDNLGTYWGTVYEPVYQLGIAAGAATKTGTLGYVIAFPIPATFNNLNAFTLGARSVNPRAQTRVVFTKSWCDPAAQRAAAERLIAAGADVLAQHQDCTRTILQVAERAGVAAVGYHADGSEVAPTAWLAGAVWDWARTFVEIVRTVRAGGFAASRYNSDWVGGLASGDTPFVLTELADRIAAATRARIEAAGRRFAAGGSPFDGPLSDRDGRSRVPAGVTPSYGEVLRMDYVVPGVVGEIPAT